MTRARDKSVRDLPVTAKLKAGQIIVEQILCGVVFSFPAAVWPLDTSAQFNWISRLTPWWDLASADWSPRAHRLRESCVTAINNLMRPVPKTATADRPVSLSPLSAPCPKTTAPAGRPGNVCRL